MLKVKSLNALEELAGLAMPSNSRDMTPYNGTPFDCVCGDTHIFNHSLNDRNYVSTGANASMIVHCPNNFNSKTLITTKYKFMVMFKGFESLVGYEEN